MGGNSPGVYVTKMQDENILVWLPSPMGDAILCTPALRAIREKFKNSKIYFLAERVIREILSPSIFNDQWISLENNNPFAIAGELKKFNFSRAILFKNSFASALAVRLAGIPLRTGYAREGRSFFLTDKLYPPKKVLRYKPFSMIDYYTTIASRVGANTEEKAIRAFD